MLPSNNNTNSSSSSSSSSTTTINGINASEAAKFQQLQQPPTPFSVMPKTGAPQQQQQHLNSSVANAVVMSNRMHNLRLNMPELKQHSSSSDDVLLGNKMNSSHLNHRSRPSNIYLASSVSLSNNLNEATAGHHQMVPERDENSSSMSMTPHSPIKSTRSVAGPTRLTVQSIPVKSQPPMVSSKLDNKSSPNVPQNGTVTLSQSQSVVSSSNASNATTTSDSLTLSTPSVSTAASQGNTQKMPPAMGLIQAVKINSRGVTGPGEDHVDSSPTSHKMPVHNRVTHTHDFHMARGEYHHSSSDENRSSGHASMSDTGHGSSSPGSGAGVVGSGVLAPLPEDRLANASNGNNRSVRSRASSNHSRARHRAPVGAAIPAKIPWGGTGIEDIKQTIQQLTMRSQTSTSTYSSLSAGSESSEPNRRLNRYSSMETVNTNVTNADEFVWVDSHNRLVELQHPPWSQHCILRVLKEGRCRDHSERISPEAIPRLGYLLQRALVRVAREVQRLSSVFGFCSKQEVAGAFRIVLCPALADSCIKACLRAAAMFAAPGDSSLRQSKSSRAGIQLPVGRFHRWMADARLGRFVHEYSAVYLTAGLENLLEEVVIQCLPVDKQMLLTASGLEHTIAASGDLWGLLQPYAHLNAGRVASGALTMPRWASTSSIGSGSQHYSVGVEPCLLTTCVGSVNELRDLILRAQLKFQQVSVSHGAVRTLFYFMRCSQLEHSDTPTTTTNTSLSGSSGGGGGNNRVGSGNGGGPGLGAAVGGGHNTGTTGTSGTNCGTGVQELCYERAYVVLPPLVEWLRVASAHAEHRNALLIDKDDIMQSARLLLPGVDCPPRSILTEEELPTKRQPHHQTGAPPASVVHEESAECGRRATLNLAFRLVMTGRPELVLQANSLLPPTTRYDTLNHHGLTPLMVAAIRNDELALQSLLEIGADPNVEVPSVGHAICTAIHPFTQHWTAITFAACRGNYQMVRMLLDRGANVEGGARLSEDKCTITPLQIASGAGILDVVSLLLGHGAHAFLSTQIKDTLCFSGNAQRGSYSSISVAAAHGQRVCLRKLLSHPLSHQSNREVLSLEEMLAEGDPMGRGGNGGGGAEGRTVTMDLQPTLSKSQIKSLQEAMYHSAENNHLDITVELRALGVPWTLHCWMHALAAAHELRLDGVIDQLLQDFLQVCPDDYSSQFVTECLPLLINIFRYSKVSAKEGRESVGNLRHVKITIHLPFSL